MREYAAYLDLAVMIAGVALCLLTRRPAVGVLTAIVAAAWLPLNNGVLEGGILLSVSTDHGLTVADVAGVAAIVVAALTVWPLRTWRGSGRIAGRLVVVACVVALGLGLAYLDTAERVSRMTRQVISLTRP